MKKSYVARETKGCSKCKQEKNISCFNLDRQKKNGFCSICKECQREKYRSLNPKPIRLTVEEKKKRRQDYWLDNRGQINERRRGQNRNKVFKHDRESYLRNRDKKLARQKEYRKDNRKAINKYRSDRRRYDLSFRLQLNLRARLYTALRGQYKTGSAVRDLCCSIPELKQWLEQQFEPGMTWDNYGKWHIDHIIPLSSFNLSDRKQLKKAVHWFNLQPLWAEENYRKGDKV